MAERRIKPYNEGRDEEARRIAQARLAKRKEALGLVMLAIAILGWWLWHTNPAWIFPAGWWRL